MTREHWEALAARCEAATGPDHEIDGLVAKLLNSIPQDAFFDATEACGVHTGTWTSGCFGGHKFHQPDDITASLDAITALIERELPGHGVTCGYEAADFRAKHKPSAALWTPGRFEEDGTEYQMVNGKAATPALALCAAFCRAMAERTAT